MDLVCILDNSGSMSGGKLESVKEASKFFSFRFSDQFVDHSLFYLLKFSPLSVFCTKSIGSPRSFVSHQF